MEPCLAFCVSAVFPGRCVACRRVLAPCNSRMETALGPANVALITTGSASGIRGLIRTNDVESSCILHLATRIITCVQLLQHPQENRELAREFSRSERSMGRDAAAVAEEAAEAAAAEAHHTRISRFMPTSRRIVQVCAGRKLPINFPRAPDNFSLSSIAVLRNFL